MAKLVFEMNQSLDGYVDHTEFAPTPDLAQHFIQVLRELTGGIYGRKVYEIMRYWDEDQPDWDPEDHEFAQIWRALPKWVVSRTIKELGPNATLIENDVEATIAKLKNDLPGQIDVAGPHLAQSLTDAGLIDEYRINIHPVVLGKGKPFFAAARPPLHLVASDRIGKDMIRLTYVPA